MRWTRRRGGCLGDYNFLITLVRMKESEVFKKAKAIVDDFSVLGKNFKILHIDFVEPIGTYIRTTDNDFIIYYKQPLNIWYNHNCGTTKIDRSYPVWRLIIGFKKY